MDPRRLMMAGAGFAFLGVLLGLVTSVLQNDPSLGSAEEGMLRLATGLSGMIGFLLLVWSIYKVADLPWLPPVLTAGLALVFLSRLGSNLFALTLSGGPNSGASLVFTILGTIGGIGTVLVLLGLFVAVQAKVANRLPPGARPAPVATPPAPPAAMPAAPPPRRSSFRPPQAPLPVARAPVAGTRPAAPSLARADLPK